jgi:hypothetical protein
MRANYFDTATNNDHIYYESFTSEPKVIARGNYLLTLNNEPERATTGMRNTFYSEVRWWNHYRSNKDVKMYRQQQLDVVGNRSLLLSYFKLNLGHSHHVDDKDLWFEVDLADPELNRLLEFSEETEWIEETDLNLCPFRTFKDADELCYRDAILEVKIDVIRMAPRDESTADYLLTCQFSEFRNQYVGAIAEDLFDFKWQLISQDEMNDAGTKETFPQLFQEKSWDAKL